MPFRDEESKTIATSILSVVLKNGRPSNLLVFGKPGTGKTAVVKNVITRLKKKSIEHGIEITLLLTQRLQILLTRCYMILRRI
ncbi:MAG: AAA family ATPase [Candidatus Nitrosocosmicus sp.]|nr:AAA family ATPase [Candidatus Nitrosocosmicus sp.]